MLSEIRIECEISAGAFSQECVIEFDLATGEKHIATAPRHYCYTPKGQPLTPGQPAPGQSIKGQVAARVIREEGEGILASIPDGEVVLVPRQRIKRIKGGAPDVSIKS